MEQTNKAVKVFQSLAEMAESSVLLAAQNKIVGKNSIDQQWMKKIQLPILTNDEDVKKYIKEFQLQNPENMIRFFIEVTFASFESTKESINDLKLLDLADCISFVNAAEGQIKDAMNNKSDEKEELNEAKHNLDKAINELQKKIEIYIDGIRKIDSRSKWQFFLKSKVSLTDIDTNVGCAKYALEALITAIELQKYIATLKRSDVPSAVGSGNQFIKKKILDGDTCSLMHAYDKNQQECFWLKIEHKCDNLIKDDNCLADYVAEYDNIDFS